jgi:hypothetical protein
MSDGAHAGVDAERALGTILGGEPAPDETGEKTMSPVEMRAKLEAQEQPEGYDGTATYAGKLILHFLLDDPSRASIPNENVYDREAFRRDGKPWDKFSDYIVQAGLYEVMRDAGEPWAEVTRLDLTGFMWGWAVNAARYCVELPPVPNPAIITVGSAEGEES